MSINAARKRKGDNFFPKCSNPYGFVERVIVFGFVPIWSAFWISFIVSDIFRMKVINLFDKVSPSCIEISNEKGYGYRTEKSNKYHLHSVEWYNRCHCNDDTIDRN